MATMRALRAHTRGGPEVLVYESAPRPTAEDCELLIAVHRLGDHFRRTDLARDVELRRRRSDADRAVPRVLRGGGRGGRRCHRCIGGRRGLRPGPLLVIVNRRDIMCVDLTGFSSLERTPSDVP
jgi:hypothetical protein